MRSIPAEDRIPEVWYRPELEAFDVNYNRKHAGKVAEFEHVTLITDPEPWTNQCGPGDVIITTETLYFPALVEQLCAAARSGATVLCVNHFYPHV